MAAYGFHHHGSAHHSHADSANPFAGSRTYTPTPPTHYTAPAQSYHSDYPAARPSRGQGLSEGPLGPSPHSTPSPFESVFDDHAYPMNSNPHVGAPNSSSPPSRFDNFSGTAYHGPLGPSSSARPQASEDIPLQDQHAKNAGVDDHVYNAPEVDQEGQAPTKRGKIRLGELGMIGANRKRIPWVVYIFSVVQLAVFIGEIIKNGMLTGSPIMIKPQFNPMIGPSTYVIINMGARYVPCMHNIKEIQGSDFPVMFNCPNATNAAQYCPLSELCGFGGVPNPTFNNAAQSPQPDQWFRFILPIFMHASLIHIGFNLLLQLTIAKEMEMAIGPIRFFVVYISAGIFGFVMGGNFAAPGVASTGASGCLFGIIALTLLDLLYSWGERRKPAKDLMLLILDMVISFILDLLPGLDNFSHIGGFLMGLGLGVCVLHSPNSLRRRMGTDTTYSAVTPTEAAAPSTSFKTSPVNFFRGRKPLWWIWWLVRAGALIFVIIVFILLLHNFYTIGNTCSWCKYLSCLPVSNWCDLGTIQRSS